jgi:methionyl-tRNA formyltransferase
MFEKNDGRIRWAAGARTIHNLVRAAQPWPIAHCALGGEIHRIHETRLADGPATAAPGTIEEILKDRILVATGEGRIAITQIQAPGKRVMAMGDFLRGHKLDAGVSFTDLT